jgi:transcriptional regulator with XRE-family HTH domain
MVLSEAIRLLRSKLGESQEGMARKLGCSTSGYTKWERGVAVPRGQVTIRMLQMCPDEESRAAFESATGGVDHVEAPAFLAQMKTVGYRTEAADTELIDNTTGAKTALEALFQAARAGDQKARELLRDTKDRLSTAIASSPERTTAGNETLGEPEHPTGKRPVSSADRKRRTKKKRPARDRTRSIEKSRG